MCSSDLFQQNLSLKGDRYSPVDITSPNFKAWFGDSKVVDADGKPLVVYHGTSSDFFEFDAKAAPVHIKLHGNFFTPYLRVADNYAENAGDKRGGGANVMRVYLSIKNPTTIDAGGKLISEVEINKRLRDAEISGHDGAIIDRKSTRLNSSH